MDEDSERELLVFTEALKVPVQERASFLERVCPADGNLRRKVHALLKAHDRLGCFLEEPATAATLAPLLRRIAAHASPLPNARRRKEGRGFQLRLRKRKGKNEK